MITKLDLLNLREQIQEDLECLLDGQDDELIINTCQMIVDRFKPLPDLTSE